MIRNALASKVQSAVERLQAGGRLPQVDLNGWEIADTKQPEHGDYACNLAMVAAKKVGMNPRALGELLASELAADSDFNAVEVAGPGFINFRLNPVFQSKFVAEVLRNPGSLKPEVKPDEAKRINVEFVSVNPNGPITIGSGRGAAYGSTLCNVLEAAGNTVHREYYINDGVNSEQMRLFAESVRGALLGNDISDRPYKGEYVDAVADQVRSSSPGSDWSQIPTGGLQLLAQDFMLAAQRSALSNFGVEFDTWFSEQSLHDAGKVDEEIQTLESTGVADSRPLRTKLKLGKGGKIEEVNLEEQAGAVDEDGEATVPGLEEGDHATLWLRSTRFGDDMDRVLRRRDGRLTYIASDVAYHKDKFNRPANADKLITILGPDHHGYIGRLTAVVAAMLKAEDLVEPSPELAASDRSEDYWKGQTLLDDNPAPPTPPGYGEREAQMLDAQSEGLGFVDLDRVKLNPDWINLLPVHFLVDYQVLPVKVEKGTLYLAMADIRQSRVAEAAGRLSNLKVVRIAAAPIVLRSILRDLSQNKSSAGDLPPLSELDAKLYASPEDRDACQAALAEAKKRLEVQIYQLVRFLKDGKPAPMRKRDGNIYALIDLIREIGEKMRPEGTEEEKLTAGKDVARFFYLMRSHDTTFDFDLSLAETKSDENPVFYVQYAHARICSILAKAEAELQIDHSSLAEHANLTQPEELALARKIADLPVEIARSAEDYAVHRLVTYSIELARSYHHFYSACRVVDAANLETTRSRLALCEATKIALQQVLSLLGVSAPERM